MSMAFKAITSLRVITMLSHQLDKASYEKESIYVLSANQP